MERLPHFHHVDFHAIRRLAADHDMYLCVGRSPMLWNPFSQQ